MGRSSRLAALTLAILATSSAASPPAFAEEAGVVSAKAVKYHDVLLKRPEPGYLFDRFYNTWLDDATVADLQKFLVAKAAESKATPDQLLLAFFYAKQGDDVAALEEFRTALATNPGSAEAWYQKAAIEARTLDFDAAIADLRKARELKPEAKLQVLIDKQLGRLLVRNRKVDEALKIWNELLAANPKDEDLAEDLIELHIDEGLFEQAAKLAAELVARTKDPYLKVTRRLRLGDIHQRGGNREKSLEAYSTALANVGHDSWLEQEILAQTEQVFRREDSLSQLKSHYAALFKEHPKRIALHRRHAKLLVELGEHDEAIAAYKQILELTPGDRANREEYVEVLAKIGKKEQAVVELQGLCEQHPDDAELRFRLATLLHEAGKADEAAAEVARYLAASDKSEYAYLRAARQLERFERKDEAAGVYQEMATTFADSASAQEAYAGFLYATDKKEEAISLWRKLADGADLSESLHVARALGTRNEHEVALELLQAREADFAKEPLYFSQLAATALALKKPELALPWTQRRVALAESVTELESALDQAVAVCDRADKIEDVAKELAALPHRSMQQTCLLAELLEAAGDSPGADQALAKGAADGNLLAISGQIRLFSQRRDWGAAADATRRILELPEGRKSIYVRRLVELCQRDFQIDEALKWITEWKRLSPGSTSPWTVEAGLMQMQGKEDDAIAVLKSAVQKFDGAEDLRVRLAQLYTETDRAADAERIYWQLYEETEDVTGKLRWTQELAKLAEQQGKLSQLVDSFEERRQSNRQSIVPLLALSEVHRTADNYEGRRQALTAAAKIKPDDLELLHHIARVEEQEGDWSAAVATLERAAPLDKTNRTKERIAKLHLSFGNVDDGFAILFELAGAGKGDPRTLEAIADAMCGIQEWERAADFLAARVNDHPGDYRLRYLLGVASEEAGRNDEAVTQFLALLEDQEELPDVAKKHSPLNPMNSYLDMLGKMAPRHVIEFMETSQNRYQAYAHQQNRGGLVYASVSRGGGSGATSHIQLPMRVESVRPWAIVHLTTVAKMMDEEEAAEVTRGMKSHGIETADLLMRVGANQNDIGMELPAILEEDPENETALALVVLQQFGRQQPELAKHSGKAFGKFRETYPELAVLAGLQAGLYAESEAEVAAETPEEAKVRPNPHFDEALKLAASIEHPNAMTVMAIALTLSGQMGRQQAVTMQEDYRQKFSTLLMKWYPSLQSSPQYGQWAFMYVVGALAQSDDPTEYIAFLEDEVARLRTKSQKPRNQAQMMGFQQQQTLLTALTFPPQELAEFPASVLMLVQPQNDANPFSSLTGRNGADEFDPKRALPLIQKVRDPVLRLLLANRFEQSELVEKGLQEMLAAEKPQLDAFLLAAGKASADEQHAKAVQLLSKARYLPMGRELRSRVDSAIVASVIAAKDAEAVNADEEQDPAALEAAKKELVEAGKAACLRLRTTRLDPNRRTELITAMEDLGLKREAEKLDKLAAAQPSSTTPSAVIMRSTAVSRAGPDRITQLVADGKRDAAARLLSTEVLQQARQVLGNPQNASFMRHQFRELKKRVSALDMTNDLLKALDPDKSENAQKISEYAVVCEMFDRPQEARAAYEKLLNKRPKDDAVRTRLIMLVAKDDVSLAEEHLKKLSATVSMNVGQMLMMNLQDHESELEERIASAELATKYLQILAGDEKSQTGWSGGLVQMLSHQMYTRNGQNLPSIYSTAKADDEKSDARKKLIERRSAAHEALCQEMLKTKDSARPGFTYLLAASEARGEINKDEFVQRAVKVLKDEADRKLFSNNPYQNYSYSNNDDSSDVRLQSPEQFLVRQAAATDWKLIEELTPELQKGRNKGVGKDLQQMVKLYRCAPEEFLTVAAEVSKQTFRSPSGRDEGADLSVIITAWGDRKLEADVQPIVLDRLKRISKSQNHHQMPPCVSDLVEATYRTRGGAKTLELLEEVTTLYLGPKDKREEFLAKNNMQNAFSYGSAAGNIHVYGNFMSRLLQRKSVLPIVVLYLQDVPSLGSMNNLEHYAQSGMTELADRPADKLMVDLAESPWFAELDEFHPLDAGIQRQGTDSWLSWFLQRINNDEKRKKAFAEAVAKAYKERPTFGLGLIDAYLRGGDALLQYSAERMEAIRAIEETRQTKLAATIATLVGKEVLAKKDLPAPLAEVRDWLQGSKNLESQQLLAKIRKAKRLEELSPEPYQAGQYLSRTMKGQIVSDPAAVCEAFFRVVELTADAQKRNAWHMHIGDGGTTAAYLLRNMLQGVEFTNYARLPLLVDVVKNDKKVAVEFEDSSRFGVASVLGRRYDEILKGKGGKKLSPLKAMQQSYDNIGKALAGRPSSLFMDAYCILFEQKLKDKKDLKSVRDWAKGQTLNGKHRNLSADLYAALCMVEAAAAAKESKEKNPTEAVKPGDGTDYHHRYFEHVISDAGLPLTWRVHLAELVTRYEGERLPPSVGKQVLNAYNAALKAGAPIPTSQHRTIARWLVGATGQSDLAEELVRWREAWAHRYLRAAASNVTRYETLHEISDPSALCDALDIYLGAKDDDRVNLLLRRYDEQLKSSPLVMVLLLRADKAELAARFMRTHWIDLSLDWPTHDKARYDATIQSQTQLMCEKLSREDEKAFAAALLASLPDAPDKNQSGEKSGSAAAEKAEDSPRDARMLKIADEFKSENFKDDSFRTRTLAVLGRSQPANERLRDAIAEQYCKLNLAVSFQQDDDRRWKLESELASRHFANQFAAGEVAAFVETFEKLVASIDDQSQYDTGQKFQPLIAVCLESLKNEGATWSPEKCAQVGKAVRSLLTDRQYLYLNDFQSFNTLVLITHVRGREAEELKKWRAGLSNNCKSWVQNRGVSNETWSILNNLVGKPTPENLAERLKLVEDVVAAASDQDWLDFHHETPHSLKGFDRKSIFDHVLKAGLLTRKELRAAAKQVDPIPERHFMMNVVLAEWLAAHKKPVAAAKLYEAALPQLPAEWKIRGIHWRLRAGLCWAQAGEDSKAQAMVDAVADAELREVEKAMIKKVVAEIEKKSGDQPAAAAPAAVEQAKPKAAMQKLPQHRRTRYVLSRSAGIISTPTLDGNRVRVSV